MLRNSTFILLSYRKNIGHKFSFNLMKPLEINERLHKTQAGVLSTLPISQMFSAQEYQTWF